MSTHRLIKTEADLYLNGPPFTLRDIMEMTGRSRDTLEREMERGALVGRRIIHKPGSAWLFDRAHVRDWWHAKQQIAC